MDPKQVEETVSRLVAAGGSRAESFFISHGLGAAYASVDKNWGIRKHVNAALLKAEQGGVLDEVLHAARESFGLDPVEERRMLTPSTRARSGGKLFIFHASVDKSIADALADLLRLGTDLPRKRILCTSLPGMGIPEGEDNYIEYLRQHLRDATLVIPLMTPAFFDSEACLVELGAVWGMSLPAFPVVVPPATFAQLERILGKVQCGRIDQAASLARLKDRVGKAFDVDAPSDAWEQKRDEFLLKWKRLKTKVAEPTRIAAATHATVQSKVVDLENEVARLNDDLAEALKTIERVSALKDVGAAAVARVSKKEEKRFRELVDQAVEMMGALPNVVRAAVYESRAQNANYYPDEWLASNADAAVRDDQLVVDEDNGGYYINSDDPDVSDALTALDELFSQDWSDEICDAFQHEHRKSFSASSAATWKALGLL